MQNMPIEPPAFSPRSCDGVPGIEIAHPVAANAVFAVISPSVHARLQKAGWRYYEFIGGTARLMTSWRTSEEDIASFVTSASGEC